MIVFLNTEVKSNNIIPYKELSSIECYDISFRNKALGAVGMLEKITNFIDAMSYEENKFLMVINDLDDAFMALEDVEEINKNHQINLFTMLIKQMIAVGHGVIYFTHKGSPTIPDILELNQLDGFEIMEDEVKLYNRLISDIQ